VKRVLPDYPGNKDAFDVISLKDGDRVVGAVEVGSESADLVKSKRLAGIADVRDLTDREQGLRLVVEVKNGFNADAVLDQLYRLTPMEESFGINNVALVDGQPRTLGLKELLQVYVDHRLDVVRRRSEFRRRRAQERAHIVAGLLIALDAIDEVVQVIRSSRDTAQARERLIAVFDLSQTQATHILDMPLRRLTSLEVERLREELAELERAIEELTAILDSRELLRRVVSDELGEVAKRLATPRRTVLLESAGQPGAAAPLEVGDDPCRVLLSSTGLLARTASAEPLPATGERTRHDVVVSAVTATARGTIGAVTDRGRMLRLGVLDLPVLPPTAEAPHLAGGAPASEFLPLERDERVLCLTGLAADSAGIALGTEHGVVKRVLPDYPGNKDAFDVISLKDGDRVVGAVEVGSESADLVFVTTDAQLLRFPADSVRPQGRSAGGVTGIRLARAARVRFFGAVEPGGSAVVVTVAGSAAALPGTDPGSVKVTPYADYPAKSRATGGVRCHRFLKGEDSLLLAWVGAAPTRAAAASGEPVDLPEPTGRRDGSGTPLPQPVDAVAGPVGVGSVS